MSSTFRFSDAQHAAELPCKRLRVDPRYNSDALPTLVIEAVSSPKSSPRHNDAISDDAIVCFGMLTDCPVFDTTKPTCLSATTVAPVVVTPTSRLQHATTGECLGQSDGHTSKVLSTLLADTELICRLYVRKDAIAPVQVCKPMRGLVGYLSIIIYGPRRCVEDVGTFMTECGRYLQDPVGCDRDVPYINPQCLFSEYETVITTFNLPRPSHQLEDFTQTCSDLLAGFETNDPLFETPTPERLCTELKRHQRQALSFLLRREQGLHPSKDSLGLWAPDTNGLGYINLITNQTQSAPGPLWRGGILADEMGLGKTLSMIALIASDYSQDTGYVRSVDQNATDELCTTLVILPLSLIPVWTSQLESHVRTGELTYVVHHHNSRLRLAANASPPDIVFTTYQTIEHEQRKVKSGRGALHNYCWRRIILDEAHVIRNHANSTAQAVAALRAQARWAISGTPLQNKLTDFLGYFRFLHFAPYDNPEIFDKELSQLWREKPEDEAVETFKNFLTCVMLRRSKGILDLPVRIDKVVYVSFGVEEERYYRHVEVPAPELLDQSSGESWPSAIQQINKLRIICNLGVHIPQQPDGNEPTDLNGSLQTSIAARLYMGEDVCVQCLGPVSLPSIDEGLGRPKSSNTYYTTCGQLYCAACSQTPNPCGCMNNARSCTLLPLSSSVRTPRLTPVRDDFPSLNQSANNIRISSKIKTLVAEIKSRLNEKHVVFSFWTTSLDMVERGLATAGIGSVRIDGSVAPSDRAQAILQLCDDPLTRVILLTISCGACGLDLTAASRVHMLEPQWNPAVEDQAFARSHRLGQKHPVTTIRYIMKGSIEEDILEVLDEKRLLATSILSDRAATKSLQKLLREKRERRK